MSNHRMNLSKTMVLLLGDERSLDLAADTPLTRALRQRGLTRTYDITEGRDDRLPDKWHGIVLGSGTKQGSPRPGQTRSTRLGRTQTAYRPAPCPTAAEAASPSPKAN